MGNTKRGIQESKISLFTGTKKIQGQIPNSPVLIMPQKLLSILQYVVQEFCSPTLHRRGLGRVQERRDVNLGAEVC